MKACVLLLLALPLTAAAQFGGSYTGPTMQQNQLSRQQFNNSMNQYSQRFQQRSMERSMSRMSNRPGSGRPASPLTPEQAQAKQQQLEQEATAKLAALVQAQQRRRQEHPAKNPQQAAAQQKADDKQVALLTVQNYREVFLPGQVDRALDGQTLTGRNERSMSSALKNLLDDEWWDRQDAARLPATLRAYADTLTALTPVLLGFDPAAPPAMPPRLSLRAFDDKLAHDVLDADEAGRLIREAALVERLTVNRRGTLGQEVREFNALAAGLPANAALQADPKKLRKTVQKSLRAVRKEVLSYSADIVLCYDIYQTERALQKATTAYLAKNGSK